jgi:hypothetical protein
MDLDDAVQVLRRHLLDLISPLITGRPVILTASAANNKSLLEFFRQAGAADVKSFDLSLASDIPIYLLLSDMEILISNPPISAQHFLNAFDPEGRGIVYAGSFTSQSSFCGRAIVGARSNSQFQGERKDRQLEYFAGNRAKRTCSIVDLASEEIALQTINDYAQRSPTIVSGIPDQYLAMGSSHTYLLNKDADDSFLQTIQNVVRKIAADCSRILISSLDRGMPCTYYGYVSSNWVIDFGPFEALVYWNRRTHQLWAPGILRPMHIDQSQRRTGSEAVRKAAQRLRKKTGYVGAFCTDGVFQTDRYVVHETNLRVCAGFSLLSELCHQGVSLTLVDLALRACQTEADKALLIPLINLLPFLQSQQPVLKLWDASLCAIQMNLRDESRRLNSETWVAQVRRALGNDDLVPLVDLK